MASEPGEKNILETAEQHYLAGRMDQAEAAARRILKRSDAPPQAILLLAKVLIETRKPQQAAFELEKAVKARPDDLDVRMMLHNAYIGTGQTAKALEVAEQAAKLRPESDDTAAAIASLHMSEGRMAEAEKWYRKARDLNIENLRSVIGLARVMSTTMRGREAVELLKNELKEGRRSSGILQVLAFQMQYVSGIEPAELFEAQQTAGRIAVREADGYPPRLVVDRDPDRKLTIGYLSPDFRQHACAHFIEPLLAARDKGQFRVIAYSSTVSHDAVTQRLKAQVDVWRDVATVRDPALANQIAADKVDIAIDLAGHTSGTRMACLVLRPAPITVNYIGYPSTTGAPGIDYRFVDPTTDPPGAEAMATEKLVRLDPCFLCFRPLPESPEVGEAPVVNAGHITFGSFNVLDKVSDATVEAWSKVLQRVPGSRLLMKTKPLADASVCEFVRKAFAARGIEASRLDLIGWTKGLREHLDLYRRVDIALDTFPYNGTTTTCEALYMGVPVVTVRGKVHAARVGASLISAVGLPELVAESEDAFVEVAAGLAQDRDRITSLRSKLRGMMMNSPLRDEKAFASRFEAKLRELWRAWCAGG